jgi:isopenicillin N synthase-like dioxygenase
MTIIDRPIATISLRDYDSRKEELVSQLLSIAENDGFFALTDHGISDQEIRTMFAMSEKFFSLSPERKSKYPFERSKVPPLLPICSGADLGGRMPGGSPTHNFVPRRGRTI